jgi:hypothetical protein
VWWLTLCVVTDIVVAESDQIGSRVGSPVLSRGRGLVPTCLAWSHRLERKNGWALAEHGGEVSPHGMQRFLRRADWDTDGLHDHLRD